MDISITVSEPSGRPNRCFLNLVSPLHPLYRKLLSFFCPALWLQLSQSGFVRSVAHDLGRALGSCSHLVALRRESIGPFSVEDAWSLDVLLPLLKKYRK